MILATIESKPVLGQRPDEVSPNAGTYSLTVSRDDMSLEQSIAPRQLILSTVALWLASAVKDTDLPVTMWLIHFSPRAQKEFNLPALLDMEALDDIAALVKQ